jgi:large subunit ribosomal protein L17
MSALVLTERIKTTKEKAKSIQGGIEKMITKAKSNSSISPSVFYEYLHPEASKKLISSIAPRFIKRQGGYTRIVKLGSRLSDNASMVLMEWTEEKIATTEAQKGIEAQKISLSKEKKPTRRRRTAETKRKKEKK